MTLPYSASVREMTKHEGSVCPTKGSQYGVIALDSDNYIHYSSQSDICHTVWMWEDIVLWRYDDPTLIEMMRHRITELEEELNQCA